MDILHAHSFSETPSNLLLTLGFGADQYQSKPMAAFNLMPVDRGVIYRNGSWSMIDVHDALDALGIQFLRRPKASIRDVGRPGPSIKHAIARGHLLKSPAPPQLETNLDDSARTITYYPLPISTVEC